MKNKHKILIAPAVKLLDFTPQIATKTTLREPNPVISHLLKFAFSPEKAKIPSKCLVDSSLIMIH